SLPCTTYTDPRISLPERGVVDLVEVHVNLVPATSAQHPLIHKGGRSVVKDDWDVKFVGHSEIEQSAQLGRHEGVTVESYHDGLSSIGRASVTPWLIEAAITAIGH
ncbi:MAG: hypothetical protein VST64_10995, partial [Nitrospirota bacterium]|nr:hypothetical protein [Nitrospirota bacterium]